MLAINEEFYSIQGEGMHTGIPMYFVRLQGCEVGCYFCDTKYTWRKNLRPEAYIPEDVIARRAFYSCVKWMCITGGEPYEQPLFDLVAAAHKHKMYCCVETSGTESQPNVPMDWITLSPKDLFSKKKTLPEFKLHASEIKCVVTKKEDLDYYVKEYYPAAQEHNIPFIIQPVDNDPELVPMILEEYARRGMNGNSRIMLQTHKFMKVR